MKNRTIVNDLDQRQALLNGLRSLIENGISRVSVVSESAGTGSHAFPRIIAGLKGRRNYTFLRAGCTAQVELTPGEIYLVSPRAFFEPTAETVAETCADVLSVVYFPDYVRGLIVSCPWGGAPSGMSCWRHSPRGLGSIGNETLNLVRRAGEAAHVRQDVLKPLTTALLELTYDALGSDAPADEAGWNKSRMLWREMARCLADPGGETLNRDDLARLFNITPNYVSNLFKRYSGKSFSDHSTTGRLERARQLLEDSRLSVKEIARICGYNHSSYFIRRFHRQFGQSPGDCRLSSMRDRP